MGMLEKVISLWTWFWLWGTLWWISIDIMFCKWEFWFFDLLMANFSLLECFSTFHNYLYKSGPLQFGGLVFFLFFVCYSLLFIYYPTLTEARGKLFDNEQCFGFHYQIIFRGTMFGLDNLVVTSYLNQRKNLFSRFGTIEFCT